MNLYEKINWGWKKDGIGQSFQKIDSWREKIFLKLLKLE
jgi:hypothetical protein